MSVTLSEMRHWLDMFMYLKELRQTILEEDAEFGIMLRYRLQDMSTLPLRRMSWKVRISSAVVPQSHNKLLTILAYMGMISV